MIVIYIDVIRSWLLVLPLLPLLLSLLLVDVLRLINQMHILLFYHQMLHPLKHKHKLNKLLLMVVNNLLRNEIISLK